MPPKIAIVTGAGLGIGKAVALTLINNDYQVVLAGRREEYLYKTIEEAGDRAATALAVPTDIKIQKLFGQNFVYK